MKRDSSEITSAATMKSSLQSHKRAKVCLFDWLPEEIMIMILEKHMPLNLDGVTRSVSRLWWALIQERWASVKSLESDGVPNACRCVTWALDHGSLNLVKWLILDMKVKPRVESNQRQWMARACYSGSTNLIAWLVSQECPKDVYVKPDGQHVLDAARYGDLACFQLVHNLWGRGCWNSGDVIAACRGGQWKTAKWLIDTHGIKKKKDGLKPGFSICFQQACLGGHIDTLEWLMTLKGSGQLEEPHGHQILAYLGLIINGTHEDVAVLDWMWKHPTYKELLIREMEFYTSHHQLLLAFAKGRHYLPALDWLWAHGITVKRDHDWSLTCWFPQFMYGLAAHREFETLRWLHHHNCANLSKARLSAFGTLHLTQTSESPFSDGSCLFISSQETGSSSSMV